MKPAKFLRRTTRRHQDAPALYRGVRLQASYGGFAGRAAGLGAGLVARGIGPGDRVALFMANRTAYLEALCDIGGAGAAAVPINAELHPHAAAWILGDAAAALVFTDANSEVALRPVLPGPARSG